MDEKKLEEKIQGKIFDYLPLFFRRGTSYSALEEIIKRSQISFSRYSPKTLSEIIELTYLCHSNTLNFIDFFHRNPFYLTPQTTPDDFSSEGKIVGQINWEKTMKLRAASGWKKHQFSCSIPQKEFSSLENLFLKKLFEDILKKHRHYAEKMESPFSSESRGEDWTKEVRLSHEKTKKVLNNIFLSKTAYIENNSFFRGKKNILLKSRKQIFRTLVLDQWNLYEAFFEKRDPQTLTKKIFQTLRKPENESSAFEIYLLFVIADILRKTLDEKIDFIVDYSRENSGEIFHFKNNNLEARVYYQTLPPHSKMNEDPRHEETRKALKIYKFKKTGRARPDIIVDLKNSMGQRHLCIIEVKNSTNEKTLEEGLYQLNNYIINMTSKKPLLVSGVLVGKKIPPQWENNFQRLVQEKNLSPYNVKEEIAEFGISRQFNEGEKRKSSITITSAQDFAFNLRTIEKSLLNFKKGLPTNP